jgi:DNA-binding XRE family transcriptional regulator
VNDPKDFTFFGADWLTQTKEKALKTVTKRKTPKHLQKKASEDKQKFPNQARFMRTYRAAKGVSQQEMGHALGLKDTDVARQTISEIERGHRGVSVGAASHFEKSEMTKFIRASLQDHRFQLLNSLRELGVMGLEIKE